MKITDVSFSSFSVHRLRNEEAELQAATNHLHEDEAVGASSDQTATFDLQAFCMAGCYGSCGC